MSVANEKRWHKAQVMQVLRATLSPSPSPSRGEAGFAGASCSVLLHASCWLLRRGLRVQTNMQASTRNVGAENLRLGALLDACRLAVAAGAAELEARSAEVRGPVLVNAAAVDVLRRADLACRRVVHKSASAAHHDGSHSRHGLVARAAVQQPLQLFLVELRRSGRATARR